MTALVEPNVPMDTLVRETLRYGLLPPVVPEFPGITAGGGFAGTAAESGSFKYGFLESQLSFLLHHYPFHHDWGSETFSAS